MGGYYLEDEVMDITPREMTERLNNLITKISEQGYQARQVVKLLQRIVEAGELDDATACASLAKLAIEQLGDSR